MEPMWRAHHGTARDRAKHQSCDLSWDSTKRSKSDLLIGQCFQSTDDINGYEQHSKQAGYGFRRCQA